jgi:hypothetical protein
VKGRRTKEKGTNDMNYQLTHITIAKASYIDPIKEVIVATIAEGTGIAYHPNTDGEYVLTHLATGYCIASATVDEWVARFWLEEVAALTDWTADAESLAINLCTKYHTTNVKGIIEDALDRAKVRAMAQL